MCCKRHLICMLLPFDTPPHTPQVYPPTTRYLSFKSPCTISFQHRAVLSCSLVRSFKGLPNFALDWLFATPSLPPAAHVWGMICEHDVSLAILQPRTSYGSSSSISVLLELKGINHHPHLFAQFIPSTWEVRRLFYHSSQRRAPQFK